jgi:hypothetical protein
MNQRHGQDRYIAHRRADDGGERGHHHSPLLIKGGRARARRSSRRSAFPRRPLYEWHIKSTSKAQQGLYDTTRPATARLAAR